MDSKNKYFNRERTAMIILSVSVSVILSVCFLPPCATNRLATITCVTIGVLMEDDSDWGALFRAAGGRGL